MDVLASGEWVIASSFFQSGSTGLLMSGSPVAASHAWLCRLHALGRRTLTVTQTSHTRENKHNLYS